MSETKLTGHLPQWVVKGSQVSSRPIDLSASLRLSIVLRRAPAVQAAFEQFLTDQQTPGSPYFHQWLTPQQVGALFGPTPSDLAAVTTWLSSQGFTIETVAPSGVIIDVHGSVATAANAFRTSFAFFDVGGVPRFSAVSEPSVPSGLAPLISAVYGLTDIPVQPTSHVVPRPASNGGVSPKLDWFGENFILPADFATIYDINSVYSSGDTGATIGSKPQHVAILGQSRVAASDISSFAAMAGIATYTVNTIVPPGGTDPGPVCTSTQGVGCPTLADQREATLDVDRVIGTAPGVQVDLIVASFNNAAYTSTGISLDAEYNVNTLLDPVMSLSYDSCEVQNPGASMVWENFFNTVFSTGAAEGISTFVSSGDSGANGCAADQTPTTAANVASINLICASSYVTCVGGTEFNDATGNYWSSSNGTNNGNALSYIPEGGWNEPESIDYSNEYVPFASGGGPSLYITKPSWQTGAGVPADGQRDTPDVAFSASGHDAYAICLGFVSSGACSTNEFIGIAGTSAAAPGMAGIAALLNTKLGSAQGNLNPLLYRLAAGTSDPFHDVTVATSGVTNCSITVPSMCNNSTPGETNNSTTVAGGVQGYSIGAGYDEVTGLGSLDVAKFITAAGGTLTSVISTSLAIAATTPINAGQSDTFKATLTITGTVPSGTAAPGGTVQFYSNGTAIGSSVNVSNDAATSAAQTFSTAGTYQISAIYSGDSNYAGSQTSGVPLVVNSTSTFSVTPASTALSLVSGAITGNTDGITLASVNAFAGTVALACKVTNATGTAAGTCALSPGSVTLASGGTGTSVLTISTTPGTSGTLNITITGTSGTTVVTSGSIAVSLTAGSFTVASTPAVANLISGASTTASVTLSSTNGFAGPVALTCAATAGNGATAAGSCTVSPSTVTLAAGGTATSTATISTTPGTSGALNVVISATGTTSGATIAQTASAQNTITLTASSFTVTPSANSLNFTSGATTGNTDTVTLTSTNNFVGAVALSCSLSASAAPDQPTCAVAPTSVTLAAGGTASATVTVTSTVAAHVKSSGPSASVGWRSTGGTLLAIVFCVVGLRRRRPFRALAAFFLLALGLGMISGCGGSKPTPTTTTQSSAGSYTMTIVATGTTTGASLSSTTSINVAVTIN